MMDGAKKASSFRYGMRHNRQVHMNMLEKMANFGHTKTFHVKFPKVRSVHSYKKDLISMVPFNATRAD